MPSDRPRMTDMLSKVGLKAPCTQRREDWNALPFVQDFWKVEVDRVCKTHYLKNNEEIRASQEIVDTALRLAEKYGPAIWPDSEARPWLYRPGEGCHPRVKARYERDLYYSDPRDQALLKQSLYNIILEKVLVYHKRNFRSTLRASPTAAYPHFIGRRITRRKTLAGAGRTLECFNCSARSEDGLLDAAWLRQRGVWLGNDDDNSDDSVAVSGLSFDDVRSNYFDATLGGIQRYKQEPFTVDHSEEDEVFVQCAACKEFYTGQNVSMVLRLCEFKYEVGEDDGEEETSMSLFVWSLPGMLDGKKVFALVKPETKRPGSEAQYWSFWQVEGGYTTTSLLVSADNGQAEKIGSTMNKRNSLPLHIANTKRRRLDELPATTQRPCAAEMLQVLSAANVTSDSRIDGSAGISTKSQTWPLARYQSSETFAASSSTSSRHATREFTTGPFQSADSDGHGSLYDTTPRPVSGHVRPLDRNTTAPPLSAPTRPSTAATQPPHQPPPPPNTSDPTPPPRLPLRIRMWITVASSSGRNVIFVDDSMSVQDVYQRVQGKMSRKLEGREMAALRVRLPRAPSEEDPIDVEIDDDAAWETVLELCRADGLTELCCALIRGE